MWKQKDKERRGLSAPERVGPRSDGPWVTVLEKKWQRLGWLQAV